MPKLMYGVDPTKRMTSLKVRDALITCFYQAHKECIENRIQLPKKYMGKFTKNTIREIIKSQFSKLAEISISQIKSALFVAIELSQIAKNFRDVDIIVRHFLEILTLIDKL